MQPSRATALYLYTPSPRPGKVPAPGEVACLHALAGAAELFQDHHKREPGRAAYARLLDDLRAGHFGRLAVARLDQLGLGAGALAALLVELAGLGVEFWSVADLVKLSAAELPAAAALLLAAEASAGRLRGELILAGQERARSAGTHWAGNKLPPGPRTPPELQRQVLELAAQQVPAAAIARQVGLARSTVYALLHRAGRCGKRGRRGRRRRAR